eukprot:maker-scaffold_6-snap-gene-18.43-mRNA-1 protein AED:0.40 eAED:0.40 QI:30/1/1/1/1/1/4/47/167
MFEENMPGISSKPGGTRSEKKRRKLSEEKSKNLLITVAIVSTVFLIGHFILSESFPWLQLGVYTLANLGLVKIISSYIKQGFEYEYYFDILVISLLAETLSPFTDKSIYIFSLIPLALIYKGAMLVKGYVFNGSDISAAEQKEIQMKEEKKKLKKERKERRGKVKYR